MTYLFTWKCCLHAIPTSVRNKVGIMLMINISVQKGQGGKYSPPALRSGEAGRFFIKDVSN